MSYQYQKSWSWKIHTKIFLYTTLFVVCDTKACKACVPNHQGKWIPQKINWNIYLTLVLTKAILSSMENYEVKLKIVLDQKIISCMMLYSNDCLPLREVLDLY